MFNKRSFLVVSLVSMVGLTFLQAGTQAEERGFSSDVTVNHLNNHRVLYDKALFTGKGINLYWNYAADHGLNYGIHIDHYDGMLNQEEHKVCTNDIFIPRGSVNLVTSSCGNPSWKIVNPILIDRNFIERGIKFSLAKVTEKFTLRADMRYVSRSLRFHRKRRTEITNYKDRHDQYKSEYSDQVADMVKRVDDKYDSKVAEVTESVGREYQVKMDEFDAKYKQDKIELDSVYSNLYADEGTLDRAKINDYWLKKYDTEVKAIDNEYINARKKNREDYQAEQHRRVAVIRQDILVQYENLRMEKAAQDQDAINIEKSCVMEGRQFMNTRQSKDTGKADKIESNQVFGTKNSKIQKLMDEYNECRIGKNIYTIRDCYHTFRYGLKHVTGPNVMSDEPQSDEMKEKIDELNRKYKEELAERKKAINEELKSKRKRIKEINKINRINQNKRAEIASKYTDLIDSAADSAPKIAYDLKQDKINAEAERCKEAGVKTPEQCRKDRVSKDSAAFDLYMQEINRITDDLELKEKQEQAQFPDQYVESSSDLLKQKQEAINAAQSELKKKYNKLKEDARSNGIEKDKEYILLSRVKRTELSAPPEPIAPPEVASLPAVELTRNEKKLKILDLWGDVKYNRVIRPILNQIREDAETECGLSEEKCIDDYMNPKLDEKIDEQYQLAIKAPLPSTSLLQEGAELPEVVSPPAVELTRNEKLVKIHELWGDTRYEKVILPIQSKIALDAKEECGDDAKCISDYMNPRLDEKINEQYELAFSAPLPISTEVRDADDIIADLNAEYEKITQSYTETKDELLEDWQAIREKIREADPEVRQYFAKKNTHKSIDLDVKRANKKADAEEEYLAEYRDLIDDPNAMLPGVTPTERLEELPPFEENSIYENLIGNQEEATASSEVASLPRVELPPEYTGEDTEDQEEARDVNDIIADLNKEREKIDEIYEGIKSANDESQESKRAEIDKAGNRVSDLERNAFDKFWAHKALRRDLAYHNEKVAAEDKYLAEYRILVSDPNAMLPGVTLTERSIKLIPLVPAELNHDGKIADMMKRFHSEHVKITHDYYDHRFHSSDHTSLNAKEKKDKADMQDRYLAEYRYLTGADNPILPDVKQIDQIYLDFGKCKSDGVKTLDQCKKEHEMAFVNLANPYTTTGEDTEDQEEVRDVNDIIADLNAERDEITQEYIARNNDFDLRWQPVGSDSRGNKRINAKVLLLAEENKKKSDMEDKYLKEYRDLIDDDTATLPGVTLTPRYEPMLKIVPDTIIITSDDKARDVNDIIADLNKEREAIDAKYADKRTADVNERIATRERITEDKREDFNKKWTQKSLVLEYYQTNEHANMEEKYLAEYRTLIDDDTATLPGVTPTERTAPMLTLVPARVIPYATSSTEEEVRDVEQIIAERYAAQQKLAEEKSQLKTKYNKLNDIKYDKYEKGENAAVEAFNTCKSDGVKTPEQCDKELADQKKENYNSFEAENNLHADNYDREKTDLNYKFNMKEASLLAQYRYLTGDPTDELPDVYQIKKNIEEARDEITQEYDRIHGELDDSWDPRGGDPSQLKYREEKQDLFEEESRKKADSKNAHMAEYRQLVGNPHAELPGVRIVYLSPPDESEEAFVIEPITVALTDYDMGPIEIIETISEVGKDYRVEITPISLDGSRDYKIDKIKEILGEEEYARIIGPIMDRLASQADSTCPKVSGTEQLQKNCSDEYEAKLNEEIDKLYNGIRKPSEQRLHRCHQQLNADFDRILSEFTLKRDALYEAERKRIVEVVKDIEEKTVAEAKIIKKKQTAKLRQAYEDYTAKRSRALEASNEEWKEIQADQQVALKGLEAEKENDLRKLEEWKEVKLEQEYRSLKDERKSVIEQEKYLLRANLLDKLYPKEYANIRSSELRPDLEEEAIEDLLKRNEDVIEIFPGRELDFFTTDAMEYSFFSDYRIQLVNDASVFLVPSMELNIHQALYFPEYLNKNVKVDCGNQLSTNTKWVSTCKFLNDKKYEDESGLRNSIYNTAKHLNRFNISSELKLGLLWKPELSNFTGSVFIYDIVDASLEDLHNLGIGFGVGYMTNNFFVDISHKSDGFFQDNKIGIKAGAVWKHVDVSLDYSTIINKDLDKLFDDYNIGLSIGFTI